MKIKRQKGSLSLESKHTQVIVHKDGDYIVMNVFYNGKEVPLSSPGEYEYSGSGIIALEIPQDSFMGKISVAKFTLENVSIACFFSDVVINKEQKDTLGSVDILVVSGIEVQTLKKLIDLFDPYAVVIQPDGQEKTEQLLNSINKEFGIDSITQEESITYVAKDFDGEEDTPLVFKTL